jgi:hypothetical protein
MATSRTRCSIVAVGPVRNLWLSYRKPHAASVFHRNDPFIKENRVFPMGSLKSRNRKETLQFFHKR